MRIAFFLLGLGACLPSTQLDVTKSGAGSGTVTSDPGGITCGDQCVMIMDPEGVVELTAKPADGDAFRGWSGDCSGVGTCTIDSSFNAEVDARFEKITTVTVQMKGAPGNVEVRSMPAGLTCIGGTCTGQFVRGTDVVLSTLLPPMLHFDGWTGACDGNTSSCTIQIGDDPIDAALSFRRLVALQMSSGGDGYLVSETTSCNWNGCTVLVPEGESRSVRAQLGSTATRVTWSADCAGTIGDTCNLAMTRPMTAGASFQ